MFKSYPYSNSKKKKTHFEKFATNTVENRRKLTYLTAARWQSVYIISDIISSFTRTKRTRNVEVETVRADSFFRKMAEREKGEKGGGGGGGVVKIDTISSFVTGNGRRASWIILTKDKTDTANRPCARVNRNLGNGRYTVKYLRRTVEFQKYHHCLPGAPAPMECLIHWERGEGRREEEIGTGVTIV